MVAEKKNINHKVEHFSINNDKYVAYLNTENKKLKECIPYNSFSIYNIF